MTGILKTRSARGKAFYAFMLAAFSCVLGVSFCLVKSPQARSEAYLAQAVDALAQSRYDDASHAALESVRLNPSAPEGWRMISEMLQQKGDHQGAVRARSIAMKLQKNPRGNTPVYAMPAELKLSLLALAETDIR